MQDDAEGRRVRALYDQDNCRLSSAPIQSNLCKYHQNLDNVLYVWRMTEGRLSHRVRVIRAWIGDPGRSCTRSSLFSIRFVSTHSRGPGMMTRFSQTGHAVVSIYTTLSGSIPCLASYPDSPTFAYQLSQSLPHADFINCKPHVHLFYDSL